MKNVVLLSGGIDSAVCLALAKETGSVMAICFDYGQANRREIEVSQMLANHYEASHRVVKVDSAHLTGKCAVMGGADITNTFVPGRNFLFLSYGVSCAETFGAEVVWFGCNKDDSKYYPDCRGGFVRAVNKAASWATQTGDVRIEAPFLTMTKHDIVKLGTKMRVPLAWTTTCARPINVKDPRTGELAPVEDWVDCGECRGCKQRAEAMLNQEEEET